MRAYKDKNTHTINMMAAQSAVGLRSISNNGVTFAWLNFLCLTIRFNNKFLRVHSHQNITINDYMGTDKFYLSLLGSLAVMHIIDALLDFFADLL